MRFDSPEVVTAIRTVMALVFFAAALAKMRNWAAFEGVVANYRLVPQWLVRAVTYLLPPTELLLALALLLGAAYADWSAAGLLGLFGLAMAINLVRGRSHIDCGCFNSALKQPLRWSLVARNACMALLLAAASGAPRAPFDASLLRGTLGGIALFIVVQCANALLAIPASRRHVHT